MKLLMENWRTFLNESTSNEPVVEEFLNNVKYLYHVTSAKYKDSIIKKGLIPRYNSSEWGPMPWYNATYLFGPKAARYTIAGVGTEGSFYHDPKLLLIEIPFDELDINAFVPDEDCWGVKFVNIAPDPGTEDALNMAAQCYSKNHTVAYANVIPSDKFSKVKEFTNKHSHHSIQIRKLDPEYENPWMSEQTLNIDEILNEIQYGKAYDLGDGYTISFHSDDKNTIYISRRKEGGYHPKQRGFEKKWRIETDPESWKYIKDSVLHGDKMQKAVTRDDLLRGRFGTKRVVPKTIDQDNDDEIDSLDDLDFDFEDY